MIQQSIEQKLRNSFEVTHLSVVNESHQHNVPDGSESHFKVVLVSPDFESMRKVQQHQAVYKVLNDELAGGVHALALHTYTPEDWKKEETSPASPKCMGGSKN